MHTQGRGAGLAEILQALFDIAIKFSLFAPSSPCPTQEPIRIIFDAFSILVVSLIQRKMAETGVDTLHSKIQDFAFSVSCMRPANTWDFTWTKVKSTPLWAGSDIYCLVQSWNLDEIHLRRHPLSKLMRIMGMSFLKTLVWLLLAFLVAISLNYTYTCD